MNPPNDPRFGSSDPATDNTTPPTENYHVNLPSGKVSGWPEGERIWNDLADQAERKASPPAPWVIWMMRHALWIALLGSILAAVLLIFFVWLFQHIR